MFKIFSKLQYIMFDIVASKPKRCQLITTSYFDDDGGLLGGLGKDEIGLIFITVDFMEYLYPRQWYQFIPSPKLSWAPRRYRPLRFEFKHAVYHHAPENLSAQFLRTIIYKQMVEIECYLAGWLFYSSKSIIVYKQLRWC